MRITEEYKQASGERFGKIIEKKIMTTTVGSLARFEDKFGELWGDGLPKTDLTPEQVEFRRKWADVRNDILNLGHRQIRSLQNELQMNDVIWKRHKMELKFKPRKTGL
jgi:hypothetical protein